MTAVDLRSQPDRSEANAWMVEVLENISDGLVALDPQWNIAHLNASGERMLGRAREELRGEKLWQVLPELDGTPLGRLYRQAMAEQTPVQVEDFYPSLHAWFEARLFPSPKGLTILFRDVTERRKAEDELKLRSRILERMTEGVSVADEDGFIWYTNPAEDAVFGYAPGELIGKHVTTQNTYPPEQNARVFREVVAQLRAKGSWEGEFSNRRKDGTSFISHARITALDIAGRPHWICIREDLTERRRAEQRNARLQTVTAALSEAVTPAQVAAAAVEHGAAALEAHTGALWILTQEGRFVQLLATHAYPEVLVEQLRRLPMDAALAIPILEAIRTGSLIWVDSRQCLKERFPRFESVVPQVCGDYAVACLPLLVERRCIGGIAFTYEPQQRFGDDERTFILVLARQCALALERASLFEEAQKAQQRASYLSQATEALAASLEPEWTLQALTRLAVPTLGDWCVVDMLGPEGDVQRLAIAHQDPRKLKLAQELYRNHAIDLSSPMGVGRVLRTGEPELVPDAQNAPLDAVLLEPLRVRSYVSVPLLSRGQVLGALTLCCSESERSYTEADLRFAEDLARRTALSLENARLYREAKKAEGRSRHAAERLRLALESAQVGTWRVDLRTGMEERDASLNRILGLEPQDSVQPWGDVLGRVHPDDRERVVAILTQGQHQGFEDVYRVVRPDGAVRWMRDRGQLVRGEDGTPMYMTGAAMDITELRQAEEALRLSEDRLRMALTSADIGTWDYEPKIDKLKWDARCKILFGLSADTQVDTHVFQASLHPEDRERVCQAALNALRPESGGHYATEYRTVGLEARVERWIASRGRAYFDDKGQPVRFIGTVLDITERKHAEAERERLLKELGEAVRLRDEFLSVASHELKTPLTSLRLQLELVDRNLSGDCRAKVGQRLGSTRRQVGRLSTLVESLLDVSRISAGRLQLELEDVELVALVRDVTSRFEPEAERAGCRLESCLEGTVWGHWDRLRLEQVVSNLLSNAIKYGAGRPISVRVEADRERAWLIVQDEGIGIAPEALDRIFQRFERAVSDRHYGGLGLGLYVTRTIVEVMGGTVSARSAPGRGATFRVELPRDSCRPSLPC